MFHFSFLQIIKPWPWRFDFFPWTFPTTCQEKARKPRGKAEEGEATEGEGKASGAAQAALDAMEQLVNTLAHGKEEEI